MKKVNSKIIKKIAEKYDIDISGYSIDQLVQGYNVELEHNTKTSTDVVKNASDPLRIAMTHLDEIPDYYTRLTKMEKDADISERTTPTHTTTHFMRVPSDDENSDIAVDSDVDIDPLTTNIRELIRSVLKTIPRKNMRETMKLSQLRQIIKEEIKNLQETDLSGWNRYQSVFYSVYGGHGNTGSPKTNFTAAYKEAEKLVKQDKLWSADPDPEETDTVEYVGVESSGDTMEFAILFITDYYLNKIVSPQGFDTKSYYDQFVKAGKQVLRTKKPYIGEYK